jgi:hypothetical protein
VERGLPRNACRRLNPINLQLDERGDQRSELAISQLADSTLASLGLARPRLVHVPGLQDTYSVQSTLPRSRHPCAEADDLGWAKRRRPARPICSGVHGEKGMDWQSSHLERKRSPRKRQKKRPPLEKATCPIIITDGVKACQGTVLGSQSHIYPRRSQRSRSRAPSFANSALEHVGRVQRPDILASTTSLFEETREQNSVLSHGLQASVPVRFRGYAVRADFFLFHSRPPGPPRFIPFVSTERANRLQLVPSSPETRPSAIAYLHK